MNTGHLCEWAFVAFCLHRIDEGGRCCRFRWVSVYSFDWIKSTVEYIAIIRLLLLLKMNKLHLNRWFLCWGETTETPLPLHARNSPISSQAAAAVGDFCLLFNSFCLIFFENIIIICTSSGATACSLLFSRAQRECFNAPFCLWFSLDITLIDSIKTSSTEDEETEEGRHSAATPAERQQQHPKRNREGTAGCCRSWITVAG